MLKDTAASHHMYLVKLSKNICVTKKALPHSNTVVLRNIGKKMESRVLRKAAHLCIWWTLPAMHSCVIH